MNTGVYLAVLGRHKRLLVLGIALALALAFLASVRISLSPLGFDVKLKPTLATTSQVLVTQEGAPTSRVALITADSPLDASGQPISEFGDPARFEYLARLYAQLATSDAVKSSVLGENGFERNGLLFLDGGEIAGTYTVTAFSAEEGSLPIITIRSESDTEASAIEIARRATGALRSFIQRSQVSAGIEEGNRVELAVITDPNRAEQVKGRPVIVPLAVFCLILLAAVFVVFFFDNLQRKGDVASEPAPGEQARQAPRENLYLRDRPRKPEAVSSISRDPAPSARAAGQDRWSFSEAPDAGGRADEETVRPSRRSSG